MDNPETRATLGTQGAGRRRTKQKHTRKKDEQHCIVTSCCTAGLILLQLSHCVEKKKRFIVV